MTITAHHKLVVDQKLVLFQFIDFIADALTLQAGNSDECNDPGQRKQEEKEDA
jgi:hypothetical protein